MLRRSFRAMGTEMEIFLDADGEAEALLDGAQRELGRLESIFSRFRPESELSRLNRERSIRVGPELLELVRLSVDARERTHGRFDPTVHDAVLAAGYDRSFEDLPLELEPAPRSGGATCSGEVEVDELDARVTLGPVCRLDLGGIAKGWAADRVLDRLSQAGPALVNAGGDVACTGGPWQVGVDTPSGTVTLELDSGGLATSGRDRRRWMRGGLEAHHVIDPSTGVPAATELVTATAVGACAAEAEVLATSLFLAGDAGRAATEADAGGVPAVLVLSDGSTILAGGLG
jgi:thiamine biosynthesis lipoprotein